MYHIIYMSSAAEDFSREKLRELLKETRARNAGAGITGALFYHDGNFLQVIEGKRETVDALYGKIRRDSRHHDVTTVFAEDIETREFAEWTMAFRDLSADGDMPGYSDVLNGGPAALEDAGLPAKVRAFLRSFAR